MWVGRRWYKIYGKSGIVPEWRARKKLNLDRKKGRKTEIRRETEKVGGQQTGHALPWGRPLHGLEEDHLYMRTVMWPWSLLSSPRQETLSGRPLLLSQTLQWLGLDPGSASTSKFPTPDEGGTALIWDIITNGMHMLGCCYYSFPTPAVLAQPTTWYKL